ncbi:MAG: CHAT domain-containing protein [Leptolyngbya sp. SIO4C5]|nr:CHAT domain-containing protein [Leptolyngbya sp. SIO4C5]
MSGSNLVKVLFLASNPIDAVRLRLGQELRDIREKLQLAKQREKFVLESREAVRPGDITQAIFDFEPHIIHFSGHGTREGKLCFEDISGKSKSIQPEALAALFEMEADRVQCVILNACYSEVQAEAIARHIPYVIGMGREIGDEAAIIFSVGFYKALGANRTVEQAYKAGCVEIRLEGIQEYLTPVLQVKKNVQIPNQSGMR